MPCFSAWLYSTGRSLALVLVGVLSTLGTLSLVHIEPAQAQVQQISQADLVARLNADEATIAALKSKTAPISLSGTDLTISGVNVHIVSGSGSTSDGTLDASGIPMAGKNLTGLGNLIIGYNAVRGKGSANTGSHNLILGDQNNYSSFGGLVGGFQNSISNSYASVSGGRDNAASGLASSVSGGSNNTASGALAMASGGSNNTASGSSSSASGGSDNTASEDSASVSGGWQNTASAMYSSVSGGVGNTASGQSASASGGSANYASGAFAAVGGGDNNKASGIDSSVGGGTMNVASGHYASISGGKDKLAVKEYGWASGTQAAGGSKSGNFKSP